MLDDHGIEVRILMLVRELCGYDAVILLWHHKFIFSIHDQQEVRVGEAPLLELDDIHMRYHNNQDVLLEQHLFHGLQLGPKHACDKIWSVLGCLARK